MDNSAIICWHAAVSLPLLLTPVRSMESFLAFVQSHKPYFDAAHALSSLVNLLGWLAGAVVLIVAWRRNAIKTVAVGPIQFQVQEAVTATAAAARAWQSTATAPAVNVEKIRSTVERAFQPETAEKMVGRMILWVDDHPENNMLAVRALRKLQVEVEEVTSTEAALEALARRHYDLVISDMGRGTNLRAGYDLLGALRGSSNQIPFLIFSSSDRPEHRAEAAQRGAQLSTNDMMELVDNVIRLLGR